jgi:hypothetical protein
VNSSATPANDPDSGANQRLWPSANPIKSSMVCTPAMAWCSALAKLKATMRPENGGHAGFSRKLSSSKKRRSWSHRVEELPPAQAHIEGTRRSALVRSVEYAAANPQQLWLGGGSEVVYALRED